MEFLHKLLIEHHRITISVNIALHHSIHNTNHDLYVRIFCVVYSVLTVIDEPILTCINRISIHSIVDCKN